MDDPFYSEEAEVMNKKVKVGIFLLREVTPGISGDHRNSRSMLLYAWPDSGVLFLNQLISHSYRNPKRLKSSQLGKT